MVTKDSVVQLREIHRENLRAVLQLRVTPEQERFVASNAVSLAQAHFEAVLPYFRAIYADEEPVGFLMTEYDDEDGCHALWRFMVDARYQGLGFGRQALEQTFERIRNLPNGDALWTACVPGEGGPCPFYERMGFVLTGEMEDGQHWLRRALA